MQQPENQNLQSTERSWSPHYHFFKLGFWINDPNGLFYLDGKYHLFFQLNPDDVVWGNMHWGYATSENLIDWEHQPIALHAEPEGLGYIFSGGAVVDTNNTAGFATGEYPAVIATFTHQSENEEQVQSIAYSVDGGQNFTKYTRNPVIPNPGLKDFRDPKVVWYAKKQYWVKAVVAGQCVYFYQSSDLKSWQKLSEFGHNHGAHGGIWECPDLFPLICSETGEERWVLLISINPGGPNGGSATQYFIGDFDGVEFKPQDSPLGNSQIHWLDYGTDCYAGITWDNTPDILQSRTYIAWMSNWDYARDTPDNTWRGAMTLPRKISLVKSEVGYLLATPPAIDFNGGNSISRSETLNQQPLVIPEAYKLVFTLNSDSTKTVLQWQSASKETFVLTIDFANKLILADRTQSGFNEKGFDTIVKMPIEVLEQQNVEIEIYADACSFELFFNGSRQCITMLTFPTTPFNQLSIAPDSEEKLVNDVKLSAYKAANSLKRLK
ncbi:GH32 C-terminal domain-containing protein, partial [Aliiglaciecola sp. SL4]|uniref:GH32 C-terminal domain-containing protein n=1 Tax=Aliiglaciecola sp. SL4 TaxID=3239806 RepID=UPI00355C6DD8